MPEGSEDTIDVHVDDVIRFRFEGEEKVGSVMAIGHSGTIRVRGIGVVDIEPEDVIEVLEGAGGENVGGD